MLSTYTWPRYAPGAAPEVGAAAPRRVPLVVLGAGPVGLTAAIDAAQRGLPVLLLDEDDTVSLGSRGVCYAKRTLEILDRLGVGQRVVDRGVTWNVGRTFHGEDEVFSFNLLPEPGHQRPGMVNLQQYHLEQFLVERAAELPALDLRWKHRVTSVTPQADGALLQVECPQGLYTLHADWLVVADGARSPTRRGLGLDTVGQVFQDRFLIADVVLDGEPYPLARTERRFWFRPSFFDGESALLHREADDVWRIDFQLGWQADPEVEKQPERVAARIRRLLDLQGWPHIGFKLEWISVYTFQCRRMAKFRHGRLFFVGDSAHQVSPFGARGANSGIQDADNLVWKLQQVITGGAPEALLDSYDAERGAAADENLLNSTRSTDFMTPKTHAARVLRDAVLGLAGTVPGVRALINSGRLSVPTCYQHSALNTLDADVFDGWMCAGAPMDDAPVAGSRPWLLQHLSHGGFTLLFFGMPDEAQRASLRGLPEAVRPLLVLKPLLVPLLVPLQMPLQMPRLRPGEDDALPHAVDAQGLAARRCDATPGTVYLLRPDQHVAARWRTFDAAAVHAALRLALAAKAAA